MIEGASDDPLTQTTLNNGDDKMTDLDYAKTMDNAFWFDVRTIRDRYEDGGQVGDVREIADRLAKYDYYRGYPLTINVRCKYEGGRLFTVTRSYDYKANKMVYSGNCKDSDAQRFLCWLLNR